MPAPSLGHQPSPKILSFENRIYRAMQNQARFLLTRVHPWEKDKSLLLITDSRSREHWIRPNTGMIEGLAFLYRYGPYDEKLVGMSRADLFDTIIVPMMRYCVITHKTGDRVTSDGKAWGNAWQSAHWAQMLGDAAWWTWDDLPDDLRRGVRRLVAHEADRISAATPPHRLRRDTKAEENAWNAQILSIAVVLMPDDPRRAKWDREFQRWALSAHLRPADKDSREMVDGRTVASQFAGANVFDDYTMENHGFVHPDYMSSFSLTVGCAMHYRLTDRRMPEAVLHNVPGLYENLKWFALPDGGFVYPSGQDWELFRNPIWTHKHILMAVCAADPDAWSLAEESLATLEKMQRRHPSGRIYGPTESFFASAPTDLFRYLGQIWVFLQTADAIPDAPKPKLGVRRLDSAKMVLHRTPKTINTFSWGAKIMAMCVPNRLDRIISPDQRSGIGQIRLEGRKKPLKVRLRDVDVQADSNSFKAKAVIVHGDGLIRAELRVESDSDGVMTFSEKLVAESDVTTAEVATGLVGILNNRHWVYEKGERRVSLDGKTTIAPSLSGTEIDGEPAKKIEIDSSYKIESTRPLRVCYVGAKAVSRGRATDKLYLNYFGGKCAWRAGDVISEYSVRIRDKAE
jgi:hypothetical protein